MGVSAAPEAVPYWRLSAFFLTYFASLGAFLPYWALYLSDLGYTPSAIGNLMAIIMATKIVAPNVWGWIADHTGRHMGVVRVASLAAVVTFAGVFLGQSYGWLAAVMLVFSFFWNASLPQFEATTLGHLGDRPHGYARIRLWGSIGFIGAVVALGPVLDRYGARFLPVVLVVLYTGIWLSSLRVPELSTPLAPTGYEPMGRILKRPEVLALLAACFLMQASHGPYYTFYSIYLEQHGYSRGIIGQLWAWGVLSEVGMFLVLQRLILRYGLRQLLLVSLLLAALRWVLIVYGVDSLPMLVIAQTLHAATFGMYHGAAIQIFHRYFRGPHQGRGQALYSSIGFGVGGATGALYSGYLWGSAGAGATYLTAAAISVFAWCVVMVGLRRDRTGI